MSQGNVSKWTVDEVDAKRRLADAMANSPTTIEERLAAFPKYVRRQDIARFLARFELAKLAKDVPGAIVECGVYHGAGLFAWAHFASILDPLGHTRRVYGFDTFAGFTSISPADQRGTSEHMREGGLDAGGEDTKREIEALARIHDANRPLGHIPRIEIIAGDATNTIHEFVKTHPHVLVSLLYLDFDLYAPTFAALAELWKRIPRGGVIAFDELGREEFPGETTAFFDTAGVDVTLRRVPYDPSITYFVKGDR